LLTEDDLNAVLSSYHPVHFKECSNG
jgi:hypothetical protein